MLAMILRGVLYTERAGYFIDFEAVWVKEIFEHFAKFYLAKIDAQTELTRAIAC